MFWSLSFSLVFTGIQSLFCQRCFLTFKKKNLWNEVVRVAAEWASHRWLNIQGADVAWCEAEEWLKKAEKVCLPQVGVHNLSILRYHLREMQLHSFSHVFGSQKRSLCLTQLHGDYNGPLLLVQGSLLSTQGVGMSHFVSGVFLLLCGWSFPSKLQGHDENGWFSFSFWGRIFSNTHYASNDLVRRHT